MLIRALFKKLQLRNSRFLNTVYWPRNSIEATTLSTFYPVKSRRNENIKMPRVGNLQKSVENQIRTIGKFYKKIDKRSLLNKYRKEARENSGEYTETLMGFVSFSCVVSFHI